MTAKIIPFRRPEQEEAADVFRQILAASMLTPEAEKWIFDNAWPRFCNIMQDWRYASIESNLEENFVLEKINENNLLVMYAQILKIEVDLYTVTTGKAAFC